MRSPLFLDAFWTTKIIFQCRTCRLWTSRGMTWVVGSAKVGQYKKPAYVSHRKVPLAASFKYGRPLLIRWSVWRVSGEVRSSSVTGDETFFPDQLTALSENLGCTIFFLLKRSNVLKKKKRKQVGNHASHSHYYCSVSTKCSCHRSRRLVN